VAHDSNLTRLLVRWGEGDAEAFRSLVPLVYDELKRLAAHYLRNERGGHTLQPTALVHEAYLRLSGLREMRLNNRAHFYGAAAGVMRRVLVENGYAIRKLNQAYFAFHGSYAVGSSATDPIGGKLRLLRKQAGSLAEFLHTVAQFSEPDDLDAALRQ